MAQMGMEINEKGNIIEQINRPEANHGKEAGLAAGWSHFNRPWGWGEERGRDMDSNRWTPFSERKGRR
jgi:hypothetical protein